MSRDDDFFKLPKARRSQRVEPSTERPEIEQATPSASRPEPIDPPGQSATRRSRRTWLPWLILGTGIPVLLVAGGALGYWAIMNLAARLLLTDQPMRVELPPTANVTMEISEKIDVLLKGRINAQVPLVQTLDLPVNGVYDTIVDLDTEVPLKTTIHYEGIIPIDTMADIEAKAPINFQNIKKYKNMHFKARLPMKMRLPVKLTVPVDEVVRIRYRGPLKVAIDHVIRAPVSSELKTALNVNQVFTVPVTSTLPLELQMPERPVRASILESDLYLDLSTLRLERKPEHSEQAL